ncbi:MAG: hypothetical protein LDLANPLL_02539 [Turneriella sp.]|nr:hypothetical protein [Turneriella sp.]
MAAQLFGISYSPWSEQARWALDHHIIRYKYTEHVPLITNALLRFATKNYTGKLTVPVLVTENRSFSDSWHIVNYADRTGHREKLIPLDLADEIRNWHDLADCANKANRIIATDTTSQSEEAKRAALPDFIPEFAKNTLSPLADLAAAYLSMKYDFRHAIIPEEKRKVREVLLKIRQRLNGKRFLFDTFTYADITAAGTLSFVKPVADKYIPLKPALRTAFTQNDLANEFADLLEWRDKLYADKRGSSHAL